MSHLDRDTSLPLTIRDPTDYCPTASDRRRTLSAMTYATRYAVQVGDRRLVSDLDTVELVSDALTIPHSIVKHDAPGARWICLRVVDPRQQEQ